MQNVNGKIGMLLVLLNVHRLSKRFIENIPILSKVKDQTALTEWIDNQIKESLKTLREIVATNTEDSKTE